MKYLILVAFLFLLQNVSASKEEREGKFLSMFNIVRFPNDNCEAGGSKNGTCYTKEECSNKGGTEDGSCAGGYGVCCTFTVRCGATISENNTYFESDGDEKGHCSIKVCKSKSSIAQLRLDFDTFSIAGPSTDTTVVGSATSGNLNGDGTNAKKVSLATRCLDDMFSVANPGGLAPPSICGRNSGEHMYVDMASDCVELKFLLGNSVNQPQDWTIRVTQYDKDYVNLAPPGCTQYYWKRDDELENTISSYNWNSGNGYHLADQKQVICIRREEDKTKICYTAISSQYDINISGATKFLSKAATCGGYAADGSGISRDAILIPSLEKTDGTPVTFSNICGHSGLGTAKSQVLASLKATKTLCSTAKPFKLTFTSDSFEQEEETVLANAPFNMGFQLRYIQS